jgi:hypothetical protein
MPVTYSPVDDVLQNGTLLTHDAYSTPGMACAFSSRLRPRATWSLSLITVPRRFLVASSTGSASYPMRMARTRPRLRTNSPAPTSSTTESVPCSTRSAERVRDRW